MSRLGADLGGYRLLLVPNLYLVSDEAAQVIERFVDGGGTLLMSFFSGIVDERDHIRLGGYPAPFRKLLGLRVEEFTPLAPGQTNSIAAEGGARHSCDLWADIIDLEGATALASYQEAFYAGRPAATRHAYGQGQAYYLGTRPDAAGMAWLLDRACADAEVRPALAVPEGVELVQRRSEGVTLLYLLNHGSAPVEIALDGRGRRAAERAAPQRHTHAGGARGGDRAAAGVIDWADGPHRGYWRDAMRIDPVSWGEPPARPTFSGS